MTLTSLSEDPKDKTPTPVREKVQLSGWMLSWFYVTAVICTWDATFIMLRPHSLPGGSLATLWYFYRYYITVDQRYLDTNDAFVYAQSLLNYAEVVFNIITIIMHYRCSRHTTTTAFMVSVMTMWKTILYFLMFSELCTGGVYRAGNTAMQEFFLVVIPNIIWIIVPLCVMYVLWQKLTPEGRGKVVSTLTHQKVEGHVNGFASSFANGFQNGEKTVSNGRVYDHVNGSATTVKRRK